MSTFNTSTPIEAITNLCFLDCSELKDSSITFDAVIVCGGNEPSMLDVVHQLFQQNRITGHIIISGNQAPLALNEDEKANYEQLLPVYADFLAKGLELGIPEADLVAPFKQKLDQVKNTLRLRSFREPEYQVFYNYALEIGLPKTMLLLEKEATNTRENIVNSLALLEAKGTLETMTNIAILSKAFMTRRSQMSVLGLENLPKHLDFSYIPYASDTDLAIKKEDWQEDPRSVKRILEELIRIGKYTLKGDLSLGD